MVGSSLGGCLLKILHLGGCTVAICLESKCLFSGVLVESPCLVRVVTGVVSRLNMRMVGYIRGDSWFDFNGVDICLLPV